MNKLQKNIEVSLDLYQYNKKFYNQKIIELYYLWVSCYSFYARRFIIFRHFINFKFIIVLHFKLNYIYPRQIFP